jgi:Ca2+-binding EF-hand superfamily protein
MGNSEIEFQFSLFEKLDNEKKGVLFKENFGARINNALDIQLTTQEIDSVFEKCNMKHKNKISQIEFVAATVSSAQYTPILKLAFDDFDKDKDGKLNKDELAAIYIKQKMGL